MNRAVTYVGSDRHPSINTPKTEKSARTVYIPKPLKDILQSVEHKHGYLVHSIRDLEKPISESSWQRLIKSAFGQLKINGKVAPYDFRSTFATQFKEMGVSSAQVADLMGHADSRMVETVYARTRHESVMSQKDMIESLNSDYIIGPGVVPIQSSSNCDMPMVAG